MKDIDIPGILLKVINVYTATKTVRTGSKKHHKSQTLKTMYDFIYAKYKEATSADFWEEIIITSTGKLLKTIRIF